MSMSRISLSGSPSIATISASLPFFQSARAVVPPHEFSAATSGAQERVYRRDPRLDHAPVPLSVFHKRSAAVSAEQTFGADLINPAQAYLMLRSRPGGSLDTGCRASQFGTVGRHILESQRRRYCHDVIFHHQVNALIVGQRTRLNGRHARFRHISDAIRSMSTDGKLHLPRTSFQKFITIS